MKLSSAVVGAEAGPIEQAIDARWLMAYSAALGETDPRCYDTAAPGGVLVHPLFPVCYEWPASRAIRDHAALKPLYPRLVHAQHDLRIQRAARAGETLRVVASVAGVSQRRPGAFVVFRFETTGASGDPVSVSDFGVLYRGVEVDGPDRQPAGGLADPAPITGRLAEAGRIEVAANLGHVYTECARIWNPIHTDIAYARAAGLPDIILHGTATLALSVSRVLAWQGAQSGQVRRVSCRFSGMVTMPSTLTVHAVRGDGTTRFETCRDGRAVLARGLLLQ